MRALLRPRFSLRTLLILVAVAAAATFVALNWGETRRDYLDWRSARAVRQRAAQVFLEEAGIDAPAELVQILGSGALSHWWFFPSSEKIAAIVAGDLLVLDRQGQELHRSQIGRSAEVGATTTHVLAMQFSPDGRYLAIVNGNGTCYLLRADGW